jgi:hypothetical protein
MENLFQLQPIASGGNEDMIPGVGGAPSSMILSSYNSLNNSSSSAAQRI